MYEENTGIERMLIDQNMMEFESALNTRDAKIIEKAREKFMKFLIKFETKNRLE